MSDWQYGLVAALALALMVSFVGSVQGWGLQRALPPAAQAAQTYRPYHSRHGYWARGPIYHSLRSGSVESRGFLGGGTGFGK